MEWPQPGVVAEIDLAAVFTANHLESDESRRVDYPGDGHPGTLGCVFKGRSEAIHSDGLAPEELEIVRVALDNPSQDERSPSGQSKPGGFREVRQKPGNLLLIRAQPRKRTRRRRSMCSAQA